MNPLFSIIVPAYNVAPYLRECLDSVLAQTFTDWEAICVDDGSTDDSGAILYEYAKNDNRFRVFHQTNAGVSAARNIGLDNAQGEWILFLDGDDVLRREALSTFVPYVKGDTYLDGILVQPSIPYWNGDSVPERKVVPHILVENASKDDLILGPHAANGLVISRIYRRSKFGQLRFRTDMHIAEDVCFWFDAIALNAQWMIVNCEYYLYRQRPDSAVCGNHNPHNCIQEFESVLYAVKRLGDNGNRYIRRFPWATRHYLRLAATHYKELSNEEWTDIVRKITCLRELCDRWPTGFTDKIIALLASKNWARSLMPPIVILNRLAYGTLFRIKRVIKFIINTTTGPTE